jgi:hypothetical protein
MSSVALQNHNLNHKIILILLTPHSISIADKPLYKVSSLNVFDGQHIIIDTPLYRKLAKEEVS